MKIRRLTIRWLGIAIVPKVYYIGESFAIRRTKMADDFTVSEMKLM